MTLTQTGVNSDIPYLTVDTNDISLDDNIYTVTIIGRINTSIPTIAQPSITFSIVFSTNPCVNENIVDTHVFEDMEFTIDSHGVPTVRSWLDSDFALDPINSACGPVKYLLTAVPEYVTLDVSSVPRSITVTTIKPEYAGNSPSIELQVQMENFPQWNPLKTVRKTINIIFKAVCHDTIFYFTRQEILHEISSPSTPSSVTFDEPPDSESLDATPLDATGLVYCRDRTYDFVLPDDLTMANGNPTSLTSSNV